jgi:hypothetical protein
VAVDCIVLALRTTVFLQCVLFLTVSDCPLQARQVLRWKNDKPVLAEKVWDTLAGATTEIFDTLSEGR